MLFRPATQSPIKYHVEYNPPKSNALVATETMATAAHNSSDFLQWLHAMKMVARLPGGMPPEFRRKLWLALAEQHLQSKDIDWLKEEPRCMCEENGEDDEELGIQIVKVFFWNFYSEDFNRNERNCAYRICTELAPVFARVRQDQ